MTHRYRGMSRNKHHCQGLADDVAPSHDNGILPLNFYVIPLHKLDDSEGRTGLMKGITGKEATHVIGMEAVHIFPGINGIDNCIWINMLREGKLHQDAVNLAIPIEFIDYCQ